VTGLRLCDDGALRGRVHCQHCGVPMIVTVLPWGPNDRHETEWPCESCNQMNTGDLGGDAVGVACNAIIPEDPKSEYP
jgi:hypothetical protein